MYCALEPLQRVSEETLFTIKGKPSSLLFIIIKTVLCDVNSGSSTDGLHAETYAELSPDCDFFQLHQGP